MAVALLAALFGASATAQETVPATPPELKDFRLDAPPPREKTVETPPPATAPQPQPKVETPRPQPQTSRPKADSPSQPTSNTTTLAPVAQPASETADPVPAPVAETLPEVEAVTDAEPVEVAPEQTDWLAKITRYWPVLAALFALLAGWFGFHWLRGRQQVDEMEVVPAIPLAPVDSIPVPAKATQTPPRGSLTASFDPADARLSLANLTVTGCLRLRYDGPEPLNGLRLRNQVISACEGQRAMIEAFHADPDAGRVDMLGAAQPGEEIVLTLELQVPREALQAYDWRERRFIAPILLLNLASDDVTIAPCRINCLVGQEGDPLSPRMQPLPIDRGPRYFDALRFRPLAA